MVLPAAIPPCIRFVLPKIMAARSFFCMNTLALPCHLAYTTSQMSQIAKQLRRTVVLGWTSLVFLIVVCGILTLLTAHAYAGTCSQLSGFPGLLQRMGFVTTGTCVSKPLGTVCSGGSACTVGGNAGHCKNTAAVNQVPVCTCVANTVSQ
jgi:hypothetical protein